MKFFITPNSKNVIATLHIVTIEKPGVAFLLILYFYVPRNKRVFVSILSYCYLILSCTIN